MFSQNSSIYIEQCTTPPLFHSFEISQGICNRPLKKYEYGFVWYAIFKFLHVLKQWQTTNFWTGLTYSNGSVVNSDFWCNSQKEIHSHYHSHLSCIHSAHPFFIPSMLVLNFYQILKIANWDFLKQEFGIHLYTDPSLFVGININNIIVAEFMIIVSIIRNVSRVYTLPVLGTCILWWKRCVVSLLFAVLLPLHLLMFFLLTKFKKHPLVYTCVCDVLDRCNNTQ